VISPRVILSKGIGTVEYYQQPTLEPETQCFAPEQDQWRSKEFFSYTVFGLPISPKDDLILHHRLPFVGAQGAQQHLHRIPHYARPVGEY
jgi:hypothetical protein